MFCSYANFIISKINLEKKVIISIKNNKLLVNLILDLINYRFLGSKNFKTSALGEHATNREIVRSGLIKEGPF